jgi:hypothetical protein
MEPGRSSYLIAPTGRHINSPRVHPGVRATATRKPLPGECPIENQAGTGGVWGGEGKGMTNDE